jgi:hypothetical protein
LIGRWAPGLGFRQRHTDLTLVFPAAILVAGLADVVLVALEKQHLGAAFAGIYRLKLMATRTGIEPTRCYRIAEGMLGHLRFGGFRLCIYGGEKTV